MNNNVLLKFSDDKFIQSLLKELRIATNIPDDIICEFKHKEIERRMKYPPFEWVLSRFFIPTAKYLPIDDKIDYNIYPSTYKVSYIERDFDINIKVNYPKIGAHLIDENDPNYNWNRDMTCERKFERKYEKFYYIGGGLCESDRNIYMSIDIQYVDVIDENFINILKQIKSKRQENNVETRTVLLFNELKFTDAKHIFENENIVLLNINFV